MKKLLIVALILALAFCLGACKRKTPAEEALEKMKDIEITVDEKTVQEVQQGIDQAKQDLGH